MTDLWKNQLPGEYLNHVVRPAVFEQHTEPSANAVKVIGLDARGTRCFTCHSFILTEEGFDADEFPIRFDVYYERVIAWRLLHGQWLRIKSFADRLDRCTTPLTTLPAELTETP